MSTTTSALPERFWIKVDRDRPDGCWIWLASTNNQGYGAYHQDRGMRLAHRVAYMALRGPIAKGLHLDHLCRVRRCVNPDHLEPVTCSENARRHFALITECPSGHTYDEANTLISSGFRRCRACSRERHRRKAAAKRAARMEQVDRWGQDVES